MTNKSSSAPAGTFPKTDPKPSILSVFDILVDPQAAFRRTGSTASWLQPLLILAVTSMLITLALTPTVLGILSHQLPVGLSQEQADVALAAMERNLRWATLLTPVTIGLKWLVSAFVLFASCVVLDIEISFPRLFGLMGQCSLVLFLHDLARFSVLRLQSGTLTRIEDLAPPFGLDLILKDLAPPLMAVLSYFSLFNVWWIILACLGVAHLSGCSTTKALAAVTPNWLFPLLGVVGLTLLKH